VTLRVEFVAPDGEVWSGRARMVIAKTLDGDLGVLTGHPPVLGILAEGSLVRVLDPEEDGSGEIVAAVSSGFFAVSEDRVSILVRQAQLGSQVDVAAVEASLAGDDGGASGEESAESKYSQALLRAAGERS
jgi:F-type H+-transporting ATPase subunit epsilon